VTFVLLLLIITSLGIVSVLISPELPEIVLSSVARLPEFRHARPIVHDAAHHQSVPFSAGVASVNGGGAPKLTRPLVLGYYVNFDSASMTSLRLNFRSLTHLVPQWFTIRNTNGDIDDESDPEVIHFAAAVGLPILGMVDNFGDGWEKDDLHRLLNDPKARANLIDGIYANMMAYRLAGVNIDFEGLAPRDRNRMVLFMRELCQKLKPAGLLVTQSIPLGDDAYDLMQLAEVNDYLVVMAYDEHDASAMPGPIASSAWFATQIADLASTVPLDKTIIGIGNYGYDWGESHAVGDPVTFADIMTMARSQRAAVEWNEVTGNPLLRYQDGDEWHAVWFLDGVTAINEMRMVGKAGFLGMAVWRLGAEDPSLWSIARAADATLGNPASRMERLDAHTMVVQYGDGEVLRVVDRPMDGARRVWQTPDGTFAERYDRYPTYFAIESNADMPKKTIAVTFDDGPDAHYTPHILDILKRYHVPATFFVVGQQAEREPGLLKRMYDEGHEIGNHTYSHPNIGSTWSQRTKLELNATQRIIQHALGVSTTLFRPPYYADSEPQSPDEIVPILRAQEMGYITVAERIDPRDWTPGVTADAILEDIVAEQENGHIILLHDGGGERSATVTALPRIIEHFRSQGYRFVALSELLGKTRAELMPAYASWEPQWAALGGVTFHLKGTLTGWSGTVFLATICLLWGRVVIYGILAIWHKYRPRRSNAMAGFAPPVSVVIPAHNEEHVIVGTVNAVLASQYPDIEIIVVENGSTDGTYEVLRQRFAAEPRVCVHQQKNPGKASALKTALALARSDIIVTIDADTAVDSGTIGKLVRHFADPNVGAVSGNAHVRNRQSWLTRFQSIEYICAFNLDRRALDVLNAITVVPGAVGAWQRKVILAAGGFTEDTLAEDTDLTLAIRRLGFRVIYDEEAVAYTEAPMTTHALVRQRFRWLFGTLQAAWKHRTALFRPQYGSLGFVALPNIWFFQLILPVASPLAEVTMVASLLGGNWQIVLAYSSVLFMADVVAAGLAYALESVHRVDLWLLFVQRFYYRYVLLYVTLAAFIAALKGDYVRWQKTERSITWGVIEEEIVSKKLS
jgi:cellulose synthase/poly-beta-1,6-N-acetylglucosamine synthase-like glycosyltransferase/peptidoglycan/xylan/chitin deacetylase (PgdA/CDA1 family)/spore germination protein YaaH